jgi:hypothetical protein
MVSSATRLRGAYSAAADHGGAIAERELINPFGPTRTTSGGAVSSTNPPSRPWAIPKIEGLRANQIERLVDLADGLINDRERWVHHAPVCDGLVKLGLVEKVGFSGSELCGYRGISLYRITAKGADLFREEEWHALLADKLSALQPEPLSSEKPKHGTLIGAIVMVGAIWLGVLAGVGVPRLVENRSPTASSLPDRPLRAKPNSSAPARSVSPIAAERCNLNRSTQLKCPAHLIKENKARSAAGLLPTTGLSI